LGGTVHTGKQNVDVSDVASKEMGREGNVDKTKYMVRSLDQNGGQNDSMKTDSSSFGRAGQFKYLGTTLTNQNYIQEETKRLRCTELNICLFLWM